MTGKSSDIDKLWQTDECRATLSTQDIPTLTEQNIPNADLSFSGQNQWGNRTVVGGKPRPCTFRQWLIEQISRTNESILASVMRELLPATSTSHANLNPVESSFLLFPARHSSSATAPSIMITGHIGLTPVVRLMDGQRQPNPLANRPGWVSMRSSSSPRSTGE
jgi:hypothetical protein